MFGDLNPSIENFYNLPDSKRKELFIEIHRRASADKSGFAEYMQMLPFGFDRHRAIFYETFWERPNGFEEWIHQEQIRLVNAAEAGDEGAVSDMSNIVYLTQIKTDKPEFYKKTAAFLLSKFESSTAEVREYCSEGFLDLIDMENRNFTEEEITAFRKLLKDEKFKIRIYTYCNLKELNLLPKGFQLSILDRTRAKFTGYGELIN